MSGFEACGKAGGKVTCMPRLRAVMVASSLLRRKAAHRSASQAVIETEKLNAGHQMRPSCPASAQYHTAADRGSHMEI
jgi:hypothetical protein